MFVLLHFDLMLQIMKKIAIVIASMLCFAVADAQFSLGIQGGYFTQKNTNSVDESFTKTTSWLGGLQAGYMVTPKLYVGLQFGLTGSASDSSISTDRYYYNGQWEDVTDHKYNYSRSGWSVAPIVRYEFLRYGNMHFNLMLQGSLTNQGYTSMKECYTFVTRPVPGEFRENDPVEDSIGVLSWGISLRPTLVYEFSQHLNIELCLDFLSIGYLHSTTSYDATKYTDPTTGVTTPIEPYTASTSTFYAGLNTFLDALRWEAPMLRLGVNYIF